MLKETGFDEKHINYIIRTLTDIAIRSTYFDLLTFVSEEEMGQSSVFICQITLSIFLLLLLLLFLLPLLLFLQFLKHLDSFIMVKLQLYTSIITGSVKLTVSTLVDNMLTIKQK